MVLKCFTWIAHFIDESIGLFPHSSEEGVEEGVVRDLPDDIVVDLLSRLPAECVLICRSVCTRWRLLTSTEHFVRLHLRRATPVFFVQSNYYLPLGKGKRKGELAFSIYDATFPGKKMRKLPQFKITENIEDFTEVVLGSCDGLLLFSDGHRTGYCYVINPITQEHIVIGFPAQGSVREFLPAQGYVCGFFRHPISNQYKLLFYGSYHGCRQYFLYTLGESFWRQINHPPFLYEPIIGGRMGRRIPPTICNRALHWISTGNCDSVILVFDMLTKEFHTSPHPGNRCSHPGRHRMMGLLTDNEQLSFYYLDENEKFIDIWILEDYSSWGWVKKWKLNLNLAERPAEFRPGTPYSSICHVDLVHIQDRQLWLACERKGLFLYQLDQNTVTRLGEPLMRERSCHLYIVLTRNLVLLDNLSLVATKS